MFKDFGAARAEQAGEQPEFAIAGERFRCAPMGALPGGVIADLLYAPDKDKLGELDTQAVLLLTDSFIGFVDAAIAGQEDRVRWRRLVRRPYEPPKHAEDGTVVDPGWQPINLTQLLEVGSWLLEVYSGRPTGPSAGSSALSSGTGLSSTGGGSPEARLAQQVGGPAPVDLAAAAAARQAQEQAGTAAVAAVEQVATQQPQTPPPPQQAQEPVVAGSQTPAQPSTSPSGS